MFLHGYKNEIYKNMYSVYTYIQVETSKTKTILWKIL